MINKTLCPICEEGDLSTHTDMVEYITLEGVAILIPLVTLFVMFVEVSKLVLNRPPLIREFTRS